MSDDLTVVSEIQKGNTSKVIWELHNWKECHRFLAHHHTCTVNVDNTTFKFSLEPLEKTVKRSNDYMDVFQLYSLWVEVPDVHKTVYFKVKPGVKRFYPEAQFQSQFHYPDHEIQLVAVQDSTQTSAKLLVLEEFICNRRTTIQLISDESHKERGHHEDAPRLDIEISVTLFHAPEAVTSKTENTGPVETNSDDALISLSNDLKNLVLGNSTLSDVELEMKDGVAIPVHRAILSARSSVFRAMFSSGMKESTSSVVEIPDIGSQSMKLILEYLYSGTIKEDWTQYVEEVIYASSKYSLHSLMDYFNKNLSSVCNVNNAKQLYQLAKIHNLKNAMKDIQQFAERNTTEVLLNDGLD